MPTKHYNKIRFNITVEGQKLQLYCDTMEQYNQMVKGVAKLTGSDLSAGVLRRKIKTGTDKSLPVGICEQKGERYKGNDPKLPQIRYKTKKGNPIGYFTASTGRTTCRVGYGDKRTREQALALIKKKRIDYIKSAQQQE